MGPLLEKHRFEKLATCARTGGLATRFLGHAVAALGKLRFEMAARRRQSGPSRISTGGERMAVSGRIKFLALVISFPCADSARFSRFVPILLRFRARPCAFRFGLVF